MGRVWLVPKVTVMPLGVAIEVEDGESVFHAAVDAGYKWPTVCGGEGSCRTCYMRILEGADSFEASDDWEQEVLDDLAFSSRTVCAWLVRRGFTATPPCGDLVSSRPRDVRPQHAHAERDIRRAEETMAKQFTHAATKDVYTLREDGLVEVKSAATGETGVFTADGEYVEGDLEYAEMVMCQFVGRSYPADHRPPLAR